MFVKIRGLVGMMMTALLRSEDEDFHPMVKENLNGLV
jgi:hypothetical protein